MLVPRLRRTKSRPTSAASIIVKTITCTEPQPEGLRGDSEGSRRQQTAAEGNIRQQKAAEGSRRDHLHVQPQREGQAAAELRVSSAETESRRADDREAEGAEEGKVLPGPVKRTVRVVIEREEDEGEEAAVKAAEGGEVESSSEAEATGSEYSGKSDAEPEQEQARMLGLVPSQVVLKGEHGAAAAETKERR